MSDHLIDKLVSQVKADRQHRKNGETSQYLQDLDKDYTLRGEEIAEKLFTELEALYPDGVTVEFSGLVNGLFRLKWAIK